MSRRLALVLFPLAISACAEEPATEDETPNEEVNEAPIAVADWAETRSAQPVEIWLTANDSDPNEGDELEIKVERALEHRRLRRLAAAFQFQHDHFVQL